MPRVSKKILRREIEEEIRYNFASLVSTLSSSKDIEKFFEDFLTKEENKMLTKRLMLHIMLENGHRQSDIGSFLGMSRETIRVHKNLSERGGSVYKNIIGKIARREKTKQFFKTLEKKLKPVELVFKSRNDMRARAKLASGDWE